MAWITAMTTIKQKSIPKFECHKKNTYLRTYKINWINTIKAY